MGNRMKDIRSLSNPFIESDNVLNVYIKRRDALITGIVAGCAILILMVLAIVNQFYLGCIVLAVMFLFAFAAFRNMYLTTAPKMIIDQVGITLDKETYRWEEIERIIFEEELSEGSDYLWIYLRNEKKVSLIINSFLDQPITIIANHIMKYYKN
jgi:hypothetical protein